MHTDDWTDEADDLFQDSRMPFGEHIEVLRLSLWRALLGFGVALVASFVFGSYLVDALTAPAREQLAAFQLRKLAPSATPQ